jgi:hypothetical protein
LIETDFVVIPVRLIVRDFEDGTVGGLIQLISVVDNNANDVSKGVCYESLPETVTFTFQYNGLNPENYLFIPTIKSTFSEYQEHNEWNNANMSQLTNPLVVSADEDFTGGTADLVVSGAKLLMGSYCFAAIAKEALPAVPVACTALIDVTIMAVFENWNEGAFTLDLTYSVAAPVGFTVERIQCGIYFEEIMGVVYPPQGLILQVVEDNVITAGGIASYPDNSIGFRPDGGQYRFRALGLIRIVEDATGAVCIYENFYDEFFINTPSSAGPPLVTYMDSYSNTISGLSVNDTGLQI